MSEYILEMLDITKEFPGVKALDQVQLKVRPGITGYVQAYYRNNATPHEKRVYDGWYANHLSLWLDIKIIFKTVGVVLKRKNLYTETGAAPKTEPTAESATEPTQSEEITNK